MMKNMSPMYQSKAMFCSTIGGLLAVLISKLRYSFLVNFTKFTTMESVCNINLICNI